MFQDIKNKIEIIYIFLGEVLYDNPFKVLIPLIIFIVFIAARIPSIKIDTSSEKLLRPNDSALLQYNDFRDQFGGDEFILVMVETDDIFQADVLERLKNLHHELKKSSPYIRKVTSLINVRDIKGDNDTITVKGFLEDYFKGRGNLETLKQRAEASDLYPNYILSKDTTTTAIIINVEPYVSSESSTNASLEFDSFGDMTPQSSGNHYFDAKQMQAVVKAISSIVNAYDQPGFSVKASGVLVIENTFNLSTIVDLKRGIILSFLMIALFLIIMFRRFSGFLLPMLVISATLISTFGLMALMNVSIKLTTATIPAFLLAVSVADSVHILVIFYSKYQETQNKKKAISLALGHSGLAIFMTSLTTAAGLLSFAFADLTAISEIGYLSASGIGFAFVYTLLMIPPLIAILPISILPEEKQESRKLDKLINNCLESIALFSCRSPYTIIVSSAILFGLSLFFLADLRFSHDMLLALSDTTKEKQDLLAIDKKFNGSFNFELLIDTGKKDGIYEPEILNRIERFSRKIREIDIEDISVGKTLSINHIVKEVNKALNDGNSKAYNIPQNRETIAQELLLFESGGGEDLDKIIDSQFRTTRLIVRTSWVDAIVCDAFIAEIVKQFDRIFQDKAELTITGGPALFSRIVQAALFSMVKSYIGAFIVICLMMIIFLGDFKIGIISMVPNTFPIIVILGLMSFLNIPFDLYSLLIGSVAIGIVVDDTIHFLYNFTRWYNQTNDIHGAIRKTLLETGRAMLITSLVLSAGFFVLLLGTLKHLVNFGFFTGTIILLALVFDFFLTPALLVLLKRHSKAVTAPKAIVCRPVDHQ